MTLKDISIVRMGPVKGVMDTNKQTFQDRVRSRGKCYRKVRQGKNYTDPVDLIIIKSLVTGYDRQVGRETKASCRGLKCR